MKKTRLFLAAILCVSLLAFAGCGSDDNKSKDDDSLTDDMADGARDAIDDVEDGVNDVKDGIDGNDRTDATKETNNK